MHTQTAAAAPSPRAARDHILGELAAFAAKRPRLEYGNYNDRASYRAEVRGITKDLHQARALLTAVRLSGVSGSQLATAFRGAFSGRLSWDGQRLEYCTGQYYQTEYRRAVCAVLASALWSYFREDCHCDTGDKIRAAARRDLPRAIASRWFN